jgi:hypothetical protein
MCRPSLLILGVAALSISLVNCQGTAFIQNWCNFEVYVWSIANVTNNTINYLAPITGDFSETYRTNPNGGGISLKIATIPDDLYITQFEYTYHTDNPNVYYDISNIEGYPFEIWGLALSPSTPSAPFCSSISCDPGVALCPDAYNEYDDDYVVRNCDVSTDLTLTLCPFQTTMVTATEPVAATTTTADAGGNTFQSTPTTVLTPAEPTTIPLSQTTMVTATVTTLAAVTTTESLTTLTTVFTVAVQSTLTTVFTSVEPTTIPPSQTTPVETTTFALAEAVTETVLTTDAGGNSFWTTLTTVLAYPR